MSVWHRTTVEGELLSIRITVEACLLENLLEILASAPFPINPEIHHHAEMRRNNQTLPAVIVEFPAWRRELPSLEALFRTQSLDLEIQITDMLCNVGLEPR